MSHLTHPIKVELVSILNFWPTTRSEIHKLGCAHEAKAELVSPQDVVPSEDDGFDDDWYHVAPCARTAAPKERLHPLGTGQPESWGY